MHPLASPFDFLNATIQHTAFWDYLRFVTAVSTVFMALFYTRIAFGANRPQEASGHEEVVTIRIGIISYLSAVVALVLTELEQVGNDLLVWRLPLAIVMNVFGWWYVSRRL